MAVKFQSLARHGGRISVLPSSPYTAYQIFDFIVDDFEGAWNAIAANKKTGSRGNFMFALLAMILLEFACRVCKDDASGNKLARFTKELGAAEPRYFLQLPSPWGATGEFTLPGPNPERHLLGMLYDLVRNGKAHQYQSPVVTLSDGDFDVDLTGAIPSRRLKPNRRRSRKHLRFQLSSGKLSVYVRTEQLFLDVKSAIQASGIIQPTDIMTDLKRPRPAKQGKQPMPGTSPYSFTVASLQSSFAAGGLVPGKW